MEYGSFEYEQELIEWERLHEPHHGSCREDWDANLASAKADWQMELAGLEQESEERAKEAEKNEAKLIARDPEYLKELEARRLDCDESEYEAMVAKGHTRDTFEVWREKAGSFPF
tara:strand:- start:282 stop:626 length:345 start_codon:yes stop_codon:yes gene_type:complete